MEVGVNVLKQMTDYDFSSPIDVKIIFDESDSEESTKELSDENEYIKYDNVNNNVSVENCEPVSLKSPKKQTLSLNKNNKGHKNDIVWEDINKTNLNKCQKTNPEKGNNINAINHCEINSNYNQHSLNTTLSHQKENENNDDYQLHKINDYDPVTFIENLLNKLSNHLIVIMQSFTYYQMKKATITTLDAPDAQVQADKKFQCVKSHFFELSFTTVESIILPQVQNQNFINTFLDNTIALANNNKRLKWKYQRRHVVPLFKELLAWTKLKRNYINKHQHSSNKNVILKQNLIRPLQPFTYPKSTINSNNAPTAKSFKNLCIFSSGTPGREISINIDENTLINCQQQCKTTELSGNTSHPAPPYEGYAHHIIRTTNNNSYHNQQPNNTTNQQSSENCISYQNQDNFNIVNPPQNYYNQTQITQNYHTQMQYINNNRTSPSDRDYVSSLSLNDNMSHNIQTLGTPIEEYIHSPIITNVTSLHPNSCINTTVRCCMCGKHTLTGCAPYNAPYRRSYCSNLCQELDNQISK